MVSRKQIPYLSISSNLAFILMVWSVVKMLDGNASVTSVRAVYLISVIAYLAFTAWLILIYKYDRGPKRDKYFYFSEECGGDDLWAHLVLFFASPPGAAVISIIELDKIELDKMRAEEDRRMQDDQGRREREDEVLKKLLGEP